MKVFGREYPDNKGNDQLDEIIATLTELGVPFNRSDDLESCREVLTSWLRHATLLLLRKTDVAASYVEYKLDEEPDEPCEMEAYWAREYMCAMKMKRQHDIRRALR